LPSGTGNGAIPAAQAAGQVVGVDLGPELFEAGGGRRLAEQAAISIKWVEGDAEALPCGTKALTCCCLSLAAGSPRAEDRRSADGTSHDGADFLAVSFGPLLMLRGLPGSKAPG
jgi:Methyltransferase domain